jgi:HTH-type transcriptional regulator / antitoxin HigA
MPRAATPYAKHELKPLRPIRTEADHRAALKELSAFFENEPEPGTPEGDRFEVMLTLVEAYEAKHYPIDLPDPVEAIKFRMEHSGLTPKDLQPMIGRMNRVYEILNRKRPLTLPMIWKLHQGLGIPAENLIKPSDVAKTTH